MLLTPLDDEMIGESRLGGKDSKQLAIYFSLMVFIGLGNKIFNKLQTVRAASLSFLPSPRLSSSSPFSLLYSLLISY
jgi:hypothetical protein